MNPKTEIKKDLEYKSIIVSRQLRASVENVWRAYTEKELLEKWWSPAPWRTETKSMNFKVGGFWHYAMVSPEGDKVWSKMSYLKINTHKKIETNDSFCDVGNEIRLAIKLRLLAIPCGRVCLSQLQY